MATYDRSKSWLATMARRNGRRLFNNGRIFDFGSWFYGAITANPIWWASCAHLLDEVPVAPDRLTVLDLGAGPGVSALAMGQRRPDMGFIGVDLAPQMVALAAKNREKAGWPAGRLALLQADALRLPLARASVDVVTGHSFLYLLPDHQRVLAEVYRVLRPGGHIAFLEPHTGPVDWFWLLRQSSTRLLVSLSLWRFYSWLHRRFSAHQFESALQGAGLRDGRTEVTLGGFGIFGRAQKH